MVEKKCLYCKFFSGDNSFDGVCMRFPPSAHSRIRNNFPKVIAQDSVCFEFQWHSKMFSQTKKAVELLGRILHCEECNLPEKIKTDIRKLITDAIVSIEESTPADIGENHD